MTLKSNMNILIRKNQKKLSEDIVIDQAVKVSLWDFIVVLN